MIILDSTAYSTVVSCTECGWSNLANNDNHGLDLAVNHERAAHPESTNMSSRRSKRRTRHAEKLGTAAQMSK